MPDVLAIPQHNTPAPTTKQPRALKVTGKVKVAIDAMVFQGLKRDDAAQAAGLKDNSLYVALARPDVKAYYLQQLDVLRTSARARNFHRLEQIRDQDSNQMAAINAIKVLEQVSDETQARSTASVPGVTIVIGLQAQPAQRPMVDVASTVPIVEQDQ